MHRPEKKTSFFHNQQLCWGSVGSDVTVWLRHQRPCPATTRRWRKRSYLGASDAPRSVLYIQSLLAGSKVLDTDKNADENRADSSCWLLFSLDKHHMSLACVCARAPSLPLFIEIADSSLLPCVCRWGNSARNWKQQHQTRPAP